MKILFAHNNFPGQFGYVAHHLATTRGCDVVAIGSGTARSVPQVSLQQYKIKRSSTAGIHDCCVRFEADCIRGEAAAGAALRLARGGFQPEVIIGHGGFGDTLFLKDVWPRAKLIVHAEYYYQTTNTQLVFDPEFQTDTMADRIRAHAKNAGFAMSVSESDLAITATDFQRSRYPAALRRHIEIVHEGIDTSRLRPRSAQFTVPGTSLVLTKADETITYVNRHLEPLRGLHIFLRALPEILTARPKAQAIIVGDDSGTSYGRPPPRGMKWRNIFLKELGDRVDLRRVHFVGRVHPSVLADIYAISRAHVYLTYPFVLSWSLLEAMSCGCVVIASQTPPVEEVVTHGENGLLVNFFDVGGLAAAVVKVLSSPFEQFARIRERARETIQLRYDRNSVCTPKLVKLIDDLAGKTDP